MSSHLSWQGINPSRSICWQRRLRARSNRCLVMPGTFKEWISSGVTEREHAYATSSSIGALSQCECPAGIFLVDLRGETRFACTAGAAGSGGGGVTGLPGAEMPGAIEGAGGTMAADTTGLPGAGPPGVVGGAGVTLVASTTGSLAAAPPGPSKAVWLWHHASGYPVLGRRVPLKALVAPWGRAPLVLLLQGLLVPWRTAVRSWWRAILGCGLPCLRVPLKVLVSPWWQPPPSCLAPGRLGALKTAAAS